MGLAWEALKRAANVQDLRYPGPASGWACVPDPPTHFVTIKTLLIVRGLNVIMSASIGTVNMSSNNDIRTAFGLRVRLLRKQQGLSQEQLALKSGLDRTYVGAVERGERNISIVNIEKIAHALEVPLKDLFHHTASES